MKELTCRFGNSSNCYWWNCHYKTTKSSYIRYTFSSSSSFARQNSLKINLKKKEKRKIYNIKNKFSNINATKFKSRKTAQHSSNSSYINTNCIYTRKIIVEVQSGSLFYKVVAMFKIYSLKKDTSVKMDLKIVNSICIGSKVAKSS